MREIKERGGEVNTPLFRLEIEEKEIQTHIFS